MVPFPRNWTTIPLRHLSLGQKLRVQIATEHVQASTMTAPGWQQPSLTRAQHSGATECSLADAVSSHEKPFLLAFLHVQYRRRQKQLCFQAKTHRQSGCKSGARRGLFKSYDTREGLRQCLTQ
jgi:hypothetical protein